MGNTSEKNGGSGRRTAISHCTKPEMRPANKRRKRCGADQKSGKRTKTTGPSAARGHRRAGLEVGSLPPRGLAPWRTQTRAAKGGSSPSLGGGVWMDRLGEPAAVTTEPCRPQTPARNQRPAATPRGVRVPVLEDAVSLRRPDVTIRAPVKEPRHTAAPVCECTQGKSPPAAA